MILSKIWIKILNKILNNGCTPKFIKRKINRYLNKMKIKNTKTQTEKARSNMKWFAKNIPEESILDTIQINDGEES